jgi:hypothetical protein
MRTCGSRNSAFDRFKTAVSLQKAGEIPLLLVDSEDPISTIGWEHVKKRDQWERPARISDEQILFMATCMETWMLTDRESVTTYFGQGFNEKSLGADTDLETRKRDVVQKALETASKSCNKQYAKGKISFELLARLNPQKLSSLSHWNRCVELIQKAVAS